MSTDLFYTAEHETVQKADCYLVYYLCYFIYCKPQSYPAYSKSHWHYLILCANLFALAVIKHSFTDKTWYPTFTGL